MAPQSTWLSLGYKNAAASLERPSLVKWFGRVGCQWKTKDTEGLPLCVRGLWVSESHESQTETHSFLNYRMVTAHLK